MVENTQESLGPGVKSMPEEASGEAGRHSLLEKLAEQTVLQAEAFVGDRSHQPPVTPKLREQSTRFCCSFRDGGWQ